MRLAAAEDADGTLGLRLIDHTASSSDANYNNLVSSVTATETDNDPKGFTFSPTSVTVDEGTTATYTVTLATQPSANVTVSIARQSGDTNLTLDTNTGVRATRTR